LEREFWQFMERLVKSTSITIDRKKGSSHQRFNDVPYPVDYGYLEGTSSVDGSEVDVWIGTGSSADVNGCFVTIDLEKGDCEVKIVLGCSEDEIRLIQAFHNSGGMRAKYINRTENE
jgi:inorganic pyrophosphatase